MVAAACMLLGSAPDTGFWLAERPINARMFNACHAFHTTPHSEMQCQRIRPPEGPP